MKVTKNTKITSFQKNTKITSFQIDHKANVKGTLFCLRKVSKHLEALYVRLAKCSITSI